MPTQDEGRAERGRDLDASEYGDEGSGGDDDVGLEAERGGGPASWEVRFDEDSAPRPGKGGKRGRDRVKGASKGC